jgi:hypothetical protein
MSQPGTKWRISDASTWASTATLDIFSAGGFGGKQREVVVLGFQWGSATSMASDAYFRIIADGSTIMIDPTGARFSGLNSADSMVGLGITAKVSLSAGFSTKSADNGLQSFSVWGYYE